MNPFTDIFSSRKNRKSMPNSLCGKWIYENGRQIIIKPTKQAFYTVTILGSNEEPQDINLLGNKKRTNDLVSQFTKDNNNNNNNAMLQAEGGSNEISPTYNLHFLTFNRKLILAKTQIRLTK